MTAAERERLARAVRGAYVARCLLKTPIRQDVVNTPLEEMTEFDRETDRCIAEAVTRAFCEFCRLNEDAK